MPLVVHHYRGTAPVDEGGAGPYDWASAQPGAIDCRWASGIRNTSKRALDVGKTWATVRVARKWEWVSCRACFKKAHREAVKQAAGPRI